jgi:hypothetical protein
MYIVNNYVSITKINILIHNYTKNKFKKSTFCEKKGTTWIKWVKKLGNDKTRGKMIGNDKLNIYLVNYAKNT